jgi:hypothetical protein
MYSVACLAADFLQSPLRSDFERVACVLRTSCSHLRHSRTSVRLRKESFTVNTLYLTISFCFTSFFAHGEHMGLASLCVGVPREGDPWPLTHVLK